MTSKEILLCLFYTIVFFKNLGYGGWIFYSKGYEINIPMLLRAIA
jgi:hypothetical protein